MNFSDEQAFKAYFEALATSHMDIDQFIFGTVDEASKQVKNITGTILWLDHYRPIRAAGQKDTHAGKLTAEFTVMQPGSERTLTTEALDALLKACEDIVQQVFAKILYDHDQTIGPGAHPDYPSLQFGRMEGSLLAGTEFEGTAAQIDFFIPLKLDYNPDKWQ